MKSISRLLAVVALTALASACAAPAGSDSADETESTSDELSRARFTSYRSPTNAKLKALDVAGSKFEYAYVGTYKFNKPTTEKTEPLAREKRIKEVMHRYMCGFFDESIDIGRNTGANKVDVAMSDVDFDRNAYDQDPDVADFRAALAAVYTDPKLDVLSGGASGNNTAGEVMGIYDVTHNEIFYFGFTNCGSDD